MVTSDDVVACFATTGTARARLATWMADPVRAQVVPAVMGHVSRVVSSVSLEEVEEVCRSTDHALGDIDGSRARSVTYIRDWTTPFTMTHVLHFVAERNRAIPTWQRFRKACQEPEFVDMLWNPARSAIGYCVRNGYADNDLAHDAMQWRIGNSYYSFLREQWVHAYLRRRAIPILQHPLADALFAVDGWFDDKVVSLFVGNEQYRAELHGRKHPPSDRLAGARPPWKFVDIELPVQRSHGHVHLPEPALVDQRITSRLG
jgi:hypothetical protein